MNGGWTRTQRLALIGLLAATVLVYLPVAGFDFVNHDDDVYLLMNPQVQQGMTAATLRWSFTTLYFSNWHPLTWLVYLGEMSVFGLWAGGYHLVNLALHLLNVCLLALVLRRMTAAPRASLAAAALFALHPLHVESVAWISELKDVLSTLFWLLAMLVYTDYARNGARRAYVLSIVFFGLGLMAKPMVITLPCVLLLCDYWPLRRVVPWTRLLFEKAPFFALGAASAVVTVLAQHRGHAVGSLEALPIVYRVANAVVAYGSYLAKTLVPVGLSPFYPHPGASIALWRILASSVVLLYITAWAVIGRHRRPHVLVGWLWFLGTLVPVIGLVQVGSQAMADRYTYIPLIGIFVAVVWEIRAILERNTAWTRPAAIASFAVMAALFVLSARQALVWRNSVTLFSHALAVTPENSMVHTNLAVAYAERGRFDDAIPHFEKALALRPGDARNTYNLALAHDRLGHEEQAEILYRKALDLDPEYVDAQNNLGLLLMNRGDSEGAKAAFEAVLNQKPDHLMARLNLGDVFLHLGDNARAANEYETALRAFPGFALAYYKLAQVAMSENNDDKARELVQEALRWNPEMEDAKILLQSLSPENEAK